MAILVVGLKVQVAVIGELPEVATDTHPPILLPFARNVTRPGTLVVATNVEGDRKVKLLGVVKDVVVSLIASETKVITTLPGAITLLSASTLLAPAL